MILLVGLGNPGKTYTHTRHNTGFLFLDRLAQHLGVKSQWSHQKSLQSSVINLKSSSSPRLDVPASQGPGKIRNPGFVFVKPQTFMNRSGLAVRQLLRFYKINLEDVDPQNQKPVANPLCVIHDDLDLRLGDFKLQFATGPQDHHGLQSLYHHLRTRQFWHLRIGVDNRDSQNRIPGVVYVLQDFTPQELETLNSVFDQAVTNLLKRFSSPVFVQPLLKRP